MRFTTPAFQLALATVAVMASAPAAVSAATVTLFDSGYVLDAANALDPASRRALTARLTELEHRSHRRLIVITVPRMNSPESAAVNARVLKRWGRNARGEPNLDLLMIVAPLDRQARISVNDATQAQLPDATRDQILRQVMVPELSRGRVAPAIDAGVSAIAARLS